jgi:hypothetical protein
MDKFGKVRRLMDKGATEGERKAARTAATKMAARAGLSLKEAVSKMDAQPSARPVNIFEGFDDWMEAKEPGWKAERAREKAARDSRDDLRRAEVMSVYGSEAALFARTEWESLLNVAIAPLATWDYWTDNDGTEHRFAATLDGKRPKMALWHVEDITPALHEAVTTAYPWPSSLDNALKEVRAWDRLGRDRALFAGGEWNHYAEVECRIVLLEHALNVGWPAASWDDVQARFDWKRYEFERQWINPTERKDPFLDRIEADVAHLTSCMVVTPLQTPACADRRTNADKRRDVRSMLDAEPSLSDREISRRCGVSPQTVGNWRRRREAER